MKIATFNVNGTNGCLAVHLILDLLETKRRPAWLPGGAGRIAELFLQSRQHYASIFTILHACGLTSNPSSSRRCCTSNTSHFAPA